MESLVREKNTSDENLRFGILFMLLILIKLFTLTSIPETQLREQPLPSAPCLPVAIAPGTNPGTEPGAESGKPAVWTLGGTTGLLEIVCQEGTDQIGNQELDDEFRHERELSSYWR